MKKCNVNLKNLVPKGQQTNTYFEELRAEVTQRLGMIVVSSNDFQSEASQAGDQY